MNNFIYQVPTKVFFGKDEHLKVGEIIKSYGYKKILLHYGSKSIKSNGIYDSVCASLQNFKIEFTELAGVEPNPKLSLVRRGIEICKKENIEMILAVGGGSVIDSSKSIAAGAKCSHDPWLFNLAITSPDDVLPVGTILTLAAAGSETSNSCVITNDETKIKRGFSSELNRPLFSILNPELTYTVSKYQTACGIVDIMMHTLERYITLNGVVSPTDEIAEGILKSVISAGKIAFKNPCDYEARATLMWCGSLSHNGLTGLGRDFFMISHQIEHEISGMFDNVAHGAGLAVIFPAYCKYMYKFNIERFARYARNVWNISEIDDNKAALLGISATEEFFKSIEMPLTLREFNISENSFEEMAIKCTNFGARTLKGYKDCGKNEIVDILRLAL